MSVIDNKNYIRYKSKKKNEVTIWLLFLFLGWSYGSLNKVGLQILYYITLGGLGIWAFIRLFTLNNDIKNSNRKLATSLDFSAREMMEIGLD